jgi:hypothetical protein
MTRKKMTKTHIIKTLGVFNLTGHVVLAFNTNDDAEKARKKLLTAGFEEDEITEWGDDEVLAELERTQTVIAKRVAPGQEAMELDKYFALARKGVGFLVVYAPSESESQRVVTLGRPLGLLLAEKYNRFTLEALA